MGELESNPEKRLALFQRKEVRRVIHNNEWCFVLVDVVAALTDSANARRELEKKSGRKVVTNENDLGLAQAAKKAKRVKD